MRSSTVRSSTVRSSSVVQRISVMQRISVVGVSGSGKTTLARTLATRLEAPHLELDSWYHLSGWEPLPQKVFQGRVERFCQQGHWVIDGNYSMVREIVWDRADTVVFLDLPRWLTTWRVTIRSINRLVRRERLWNGNRESLRNLLSADPERNVVLWSWQTHSRRRREMAAAESDPRWAHLRFVRLPTPAQVEAFASAEHVRGTVRPMSVLDPTIIRPRFPALVAHPEVVHTCAPGGTQILDTVLDAMRQAAIEANANQHAAFDASGRVDDLCADARQRFADLLGSEPESIVFGPNMTTLAFHLSHALEELLATGGEIVCTRLDHDANVAPWLGLAERTGATIRWIDITEDGRLDTDSIQQAVGERTRLVTFPLASNAFGTVVDPAPIVAAASQVGALTVMDAVHGAPHLPIDRRAMGVDVVLCSPYKFFGPHAGVMAADPDLLARLGPDKVRPSPDAGPERWQTGAASFETIAGSAAAAAYLLDEITLPQIVEHERSLSQAFLAGLAERPIWTLHGPSTPDGRTPTFAVTHDRVAPDTVAAVLAAHKVNVYSGHYYAVEPMMRMGLLDRGGAVRIGFVHYHGSDDVERVLAAMDAVDASAAEA